MSLDWGIVTQFALSLPDSEMATYYGAPAIKTNGRAFVMTGREADSFCLAIDLDMVEVLKETDPDTYWQTPHYEGWPNVLVRYNNPDPGRVFATIESAYSWAQKRSKPKPRKK